MNQRFDISGIYKITNIQNGKIYIGSAINIESRKRIHLSALRKGNHHNPHLLAAYKKYGEDSFVWDILEHVTQLNDLLYREQKYLDEVKPFDRNIGYNVLPTAGSPYRREYSFESRKKMSMSQLGRKRSNKTNVKIVSKMNKKVYQLDTSTLEIVGEFLSLKEAEQITGIRRQAISGTCRNVTKSAGGYYWTFDGENFTPPKKCNEIKRPMRYIKCSTTGHMWVSFKLAEIGLKLTKNQIYTRLKRGDLEYYYDYN